MLYCLQPGFYHVLMYAWSGAWYIGNVSLLKSTVFFYLVVPFYSVILLSINPLHHLLCVSKTS